MRLAASLALAVVALAGCGDDGSAPAAATSTTVVDATTTTTTPDATTVAPAPIALRGDGLGVVDLGASPDAAIAAVTEELGPPSVDAGWSPSFSVYGTCPGEQIRGVEWEGLVLLFTDGTTDFGAGEHLFAWRITGAPPAVGTRAGLGFGATAADAEELYPGAVERVPAEDPFPAFLQVAVDGGAITAFLDDDDTITNLEAGAPCGE